MGMYTELYICCQLTNLTEKDVQVLSYMFSRDEDTSPFPPEDLPDHPFFKCSRWDCVGRSSSYYFVPESISTFLKDNISEEYSLIFRSDFKNYDGEVKYFLDYIMPFVTETGHIGHSRYEEEFHPTLIYK